MKTLLLALLLQSFAFAEVQYSVNDLIVEKGVAREKNSGRLATGCLSTRSSSSASGRETPLLDGLVHGVLRTFIDGGICVCEENWISGKLDGTVTYYYPSRKIQNERNYKSGILNGEVREFFEDGSVKLSGGYLGGLMNGSWVRYSSSGEVLERMNFQSGVLKTEILSLGDAQRFIDFIVR